MWEKEGRSQAGWEREGRRKECRWEGRKEIVDRARGEEGEKGPW